MIDDDDNDDDYRLPFLAFGTLHQYLKMIKNTVTLPISSSIMMIMIMIQILSTMILAVMMMMVIWNCH